MCSAAPRTCCNPRPDVPDDVNSPMSRPYLSTNGSRIQSSEALPSLRTTAQDGTSPPPSDEELEHFAAELQQEIINNPPIRSDLSFHWNGTREITGQNPASAVAAGKELLATLKKAS